MKSLNPKKTIKAAGSSSSGGADNIDATGANSDNYNNSNNKSNTISNDNGSNDNSNNDVDTMNESDENILATIVPKRSRLLVFPHTCYHEGNKAISLPKLLLRGEMI